MSEEFPTPEQLKFFYLWLQGEIEESLLYYNTAGQKVGHCFWLTPNIRNTLERVMKDIGMPDIRKNLQRKMESVNNINKISE